MYDASSLLNENFLADILLEAIVTDQITFGLEVMCWAHYVPTKIESVIYSKSGEELLYEMGDEMQAVESYVAGKKDILAVRSVYINISSMNLLQNTRILAHTGGIPIIRKSKKSLWVNEIYVLNEKKDIIKTFLDEF
ncbi:hypothetical protein HYU07_03755 [Candidatus Woesearchaeota archaeon]|nr:hypothetical protein [Candidatus Woesearchaeota archaeon]